VTPRQIVRPGPYSEIASKGPRQSGTAILPVSVAIEISEALFAGAISAESPQRDIESELLARLGVQAEVRLVDRQATAASLNQT
jgi:hypothetical protein